MNLAYFTSYLEVVRRGSFSEAAKALGVSQPTISFQVQRLERDLSTKLLDRHGGRVTMTAAGREFRDFAVQVLAEQAALQERLAALQDAVAGTLLLGASTNPAEQLLPRLLAAFQKLHPSVRARIHVADTAVIADMVLARECDTGFVGAEVKRRGLVCRKIAEDPLLLIAAPGHPLAKRNGPVLLHELEGQTFVAREEGSGTQQTVEDLLAARGVNPQRLAPRLIAGSNQAVVNAVEAGAGLAFASQEAASRSLELERIVAIPLEGAGWVRGIYLIHPVAPVKTRLFQEFIGFVHSWGAG